MENEARDHFLRQIEMLAQTAAFHGFRIEAGVLYVLIAACRSNRLDKLRQINEDFTNESIDILSAAEQIDNEEENQDGI